MCLGRALGRGARKQCWGPWAPSLKPASAPFLSSAHYRSRGENGWSRFRLPPSRIPLIEYLLITRRSTSSSNSVRSIADRVSSRPPRRRPSPARPGLPTPSAAAPRRRRARPRRGRRCGSTARRRGRGSCRTAVGRGARRTGSGPVLRQRRRRRGARRRAAAGLAAVLGSSHEIVKRAAYAGSPAGRKADAHRDTLDRWQRRHHRHWGRLARKRFLGVCRIGLVSLSNVDNIRPL